MNSIHSAFLAWATILVAGALPGATARAQTCFDFGSIPVAASWQASPIPLGCALLPNWPQPNWPQPNWPQQQWPQWHLFTPPHRAPATHAGFAPGDARELPRLLIHYRCTGLLLLPVVVDRVRYMGYVIDQPEVPCGGTTP
ncbi:MAG: hypothetical protein U1E73_04110 [Planctomycetota bacterium]